MSQEFQYSFSTDIQSYQDSLLSYIYILHQFKRELLILKQYILYSTIRFNWICTNHPYVKTINKSELKVIHKYSLSICRTRSVSVVEKGSLSHITPSISTNPSTTNENQPSLKNLRDYKKNLSIPDGNLLMLEFDDIRPCKSLP